jgi:ribosomal protein S18 acetylase RimI-like enzyme
LQEVFTILSDCRLQLDAQGIHQWTGSYPSLTIIEDDIKGGHLYCAMSGSQCLGTVSISEAQEPEYSAVPWTDIPGRVIVIHRLAVHPQHQGKGLAGKLMDFAEAYGLDHDYSSIRLDAFSRNRQVLQFYENRGYQKRGEVFFAGRVHPSIAMRRTCHNID